MDPRIYAHILRKFFPACGKKDLQSASYRKHPFLLPPKGPFIKYVTLEEGGGGPRRCDSLWEGGQEHVTSR